MTTIQDNIHSLSQQIRRCEKQYDRVAETVKLLAVSKQQSAETIRLACLAGQYAFGENYLQEALLKQAELTDLDIEWHFIGHIQSRKIKAIAQVFDWVQTISTPEMAIAFNHYRASARTPLNVCIQVKIEDEDSRTGVLPENLTQMADLMLELPHLQWRGLMYLPIESTPADRNRRLQQIGTVFKTLQVTYPFLDTLSMGMTDDFESAISAGSTVIRIGTGIFGYR